MNALIKYNQILTNAKKMLRLTGTDNDIWLSDVINQKARDFSTNETLKMEDCTVTIENNKFLLPENCKQIVAGRAKNGCVPAIFVNVPFFKQCGCTSIQYPSIVNVIDINGRWANMLNKVPDGTEIQIAYLKVWEIDGQVVINEEMYSALSYWAAYFFAITFAELYTPEQRASWKRLYDYQAHRVRGLASRRIYEQEKQQIRAVMIQMVNGMASWTALTAQFNSFFYPTITSY